MTDPNRRPRICDISCVEKFDSWLALSSMSTAEAMRQYVARLVELNIGWDGNHGDRICYGVRPSTMVNDESVEVRLLWFITNLDKWDCFSVEGNWFYLVFVVMILINVSWTFLRLLRCFLKTSLWISSFLLLTSLSYLLLSILWTFFSLLLIQMAAFFRFDCILWISQNFNSFPVSYFSYPISALYGFLYRLTEMKFMSFSFILKFFILILIRCFFDHACYFYDFGSEQSVCFLLL